MRKLIYILCCLSLIACQVHKKNANKIIPEGRFIQLLVEYHLAEGIQITPYFMQHTKQFAAISLCDTLFKNNRVTKAMFDSTVAFYTRDPEKYDQVYEKVITELNKRKAALENNPKKKADKKVEKKIK